MSDLPVILIVDDQRDMVRLLHSCLLGLDGEMKIIDAPSGEEALFEASRCKIDLLVADYLLPGMSGVELMRKIKVRNPNLKIIFISGMTQREARDEMLSAGAVAIFDKPVPLADFLDAVERSLGLVRASFPPESGKDAEEHRQSLSKLLTGFCQKLNADAVYLINDGGRVLARAGNQYESSMEVSMLSAVMAIHRMSLKLARVIRQESLDNYQVFRGRDHDLLFISVDLSHGLLLAGKELAMPEHLIHTVEAMISVRGDVENVLRSLEAYQ